MFYDSSFIFHSHNVSIGRDFGFSFAHAPTPLQPSLFHTCTNASPTIGAHTFFTVAIRGSRECNFFRKTFPWQLLSVRSSRLLCCKIFVLKYFHRMSTLRKFFNTKIFPTKISYNKNFPIYGTCNYSVCTKT